MIRIFHNDDMDDDQYENSNDIALPTILKIYYTDINILSPTTTTTPMETLSHSI